MHVLMAWTWVLELWHAAEESDDIWIKPHPLFKLMLRSIGLFVHPEAAYSHASLSRPSRRSLPTALGPSACSSQISSRRWPA